jgi:hypothetical protein
MIATAAALLLSTAAVRAEEGKKPKKDDDADKVVSKLIQLGSGVHKVKTDDQGRIQSCVIVGQSRISTALGKAKGLEVARQRAQLSASAEFVKWLKEKVEVHQKSEDETILFIEGSEGNDKDALRESGKAVEKTTQKIEVTAKGLARGFQVLGTDVSDEDKTYTVVIGWSAKAAAGTKKVSKELEDDGDAKDKEPGKDDGDPKKQIKKKRVISDDIKKFID